MESQEKGKALPFITFHEKQGFSLNKDAEQFLKSLDDSPLGIISIVGKYRTGKSFFINRVLLNTNGEGFNVGPTINPCTKGLWLWNQTLKSENSDHENMKVLLIDTEGFAGLDENSNHDTRIFLFSLLLSSFFVYNSVGNIDENALQNLSLIVNLAKEIQVKARSQESDPEEIAQYFPQFLWIVRDFALKLIDPSGNAMNAKDYLESALQPQKGVSDSVESKNRIRRLLKLFFKERDCCTMIRPLENEKDLQRLNHLPDEDLRPEFIDQMKMVRKRIYKKVKPKMLNGKYLTGNMLLEITKAYILAINSGGVPNIENAWTYLCKQESHKALEESLTFVDKKLGEVSSANPIDPSEVKNLRNQLKEDMVNFFKKKSVGSQEELKALYEEMEKSFNERYMKFKEKNKEEWKKHFETWISERSKVEERLRVDDFSNYYEFHHEMEKLKELYEKEAPKGVNKDGFWKDFSQRIYANAAQSLSKKAEEQFSHQNRRLNQKLEMVESELANRKKEFDSEKTSLYDKLHESEREKAFLKAQESNTTDKIATLRAEKERFEKLYHEAVNKSKEKEERMEKEYRDRIFELERRLDSVRNESSYKNSDFDKKNALLEQELQFIKRENQNLKEKCEKLEEERNRLISEIRQREDALEEKKKRISELEFAKQQEIGNIRYEFERKFNELQNDADKRRDSKSPNEWAMEKSYLENQINFLKSQLEENKRLHDALLLALEQGLNTGGDQKEGTSDLVETNRNLSAAVDKMEQRCKVLEEKNEKLKKYKRMVKNSTALQCIHCSKFISCNIFVQHITNCVNMNNGIQKTQLMSTMPINTSSFQNTVSYQQEQYSQNNIDINNLQISINQTMVKENSDAKPYTEYLIQVTYNGNRWSVSRKYKMFSELHHSLTNSFPTLKFPESAFTILGAFNNFNYTSNSKRPTVIEERRKALQQYLRDLAKIDLVRNSTPFKRFLELEKPEGDSYEKSTKGSSSALNSYRDDKKMIISNLNSERNYEEYPNFNAIYPPSKNDSYMNGGANVSQGEDLFPQRDNVKVDKKLFTQSPQSFMKNWQEKQATNKENKNPRNPSDIFNQTQPLKQREREEEADMNKIENIDFSDIGLTNNQEYVGNDYSQDKSFLNQLRNENYMVHNTNSGYINNGQSSSPFGGYLSEKGYISQNSTAGKNIKLNINDLNSQHGSSSQYNQPKNSAHARYSSNLENNGSSGLPLSATTNSAKYGNRSQNQIPPSDGRNLAQQNYKNLKNTAISNSPISPTKYFPKSINERSGSVPKEIANANQNVRMSAQFSKNSFQNV